MSLYNPSGKNPLKLRADQIYLDDGAYVWDKALEKFVSLAESNSVINFDYLHKDNIAMTGTSGGSDTGNNLSSDMLTFTAGNTSSSLAADQLELTGAKSSMTVNNQGITALDGSGSNDISPGSVYLQNNSNQFSTVKPTGLSITGSDKTNVDLESSFLKINSGGTTVANLSTSGLVLSNGSSSTTLTPTSLNGSSITCSNIDIKSGTSTFHTDQSTLYLENTVDKSSCNIQSSNIEIFSNGSGSKLVKADIDKLHSLNQFSPVTYIDKNPYDLQTYATGTNPSTIIDGSTHCYYTPPNYGNFNVGDSIQFWCEAKLTGGTSNYAYVKVYLPANNEFTFQMMLTGGAFLGLNSYSSLTSDYLNYPSFSVRRAPYGSYDTLNIKLPTNGETQNTFTPYVFLFNADKLNNGNSVTFAACINAFCCSNVNAYNGGTVVSNK